jgi:hypothetical protein
VGEILPSIGERWLLIDFLLKFLTGIFLRFQFYVILSEYRKNVLAGIHRNDISDRAMLISIMTKPDTKFHPRIKLVLQDNVQI